MVRITPGENCPSCRASGKSLKTQLPQTEINRFDILNEPNQEIQLDFAGPIKFKTRGDVFILVAVDRFSKWPTAQVCKNTDSRTVVKIFNKILFRHWYTKSNSHRQRQLFQKLGIQTLLQWRKHTTNTIYPKSTHGDRISRKNDTHD